MSTANIIDLADTIRGPGGFVAGGVKAGIKPSGSLDLGAILSDRPAVAAGVFTRNLFCGAPVTVNKQRLAAQPTARGVIVNAGISNVCTGEQGLADARTMTRTAEKAASVEDDSFLVASTGVIGDPLPMGKIATATPELMQSLSADGWTTFAQSIMTTDTHPKLAQRRIAIQGRDVTILGVAKGVGMIEPNMATMLAFLTTDYALDAATAQAILRRVSDRTFNCMTVDGDTSTSDMALLLANGAALHGSGRTKLTPDDDTAFEAALGEVCEELTRMLARDGEGATRLITIDVAGAVTDADAQRIAKTIANSPLVKTAIFGRDPNWGRICGAAGRAGVAFDPARTTVHLQNVKLLEAGEPVAFDREALSNALDAKDVSIDLSVGDGPGTARVWTCDLTYDYVKINAEYTT